MSEARRSQPALSRLIQLAALLTLGLLAAPSVAAAQGGPPGGEASVEGYMAARDGRGEQRLGELEEFATWCQKNKVLAARDRALAALLPLAPDHKKARKYLKYTYDRKGKRWYRKRPYKEPASGKAELAAEAATRRAALDAGYVEDLLELLSRHEEAFDEGGLLEQYAWMLPQAPDHPQLRELLGFIAVEREGRMHWTTKVAQETRERRSAIERTLKEARQSVEKPTTGTVELRERRLDLKWKRPLECGPTVRVSHMVKAKEATTVAHNAAVQWQIFPELLGGKGAVPRAYQIYLIEDKDTREAFIETFEDFSASDREQAFQRAGYTTGTFDETFACAWAPASVNRIDMACKQATTMYIYFNYRIDPRTGWVVEGIGSFVSQLIVGTKLSPTVAPSRYEKQGKELEDKLKAVGQDWIELAIPVLRGAKPTLLAGTLGRTSSEMTSEDHVLAYSLVAYLREGHGVETLQRVLEHLGDRKMGSVEALELVLERPLPMIQKELLGYLEEVGGHGKRGR